MLVSTTDGAYAGDVRMQTPSFCNAGPGVDGGKRPRQMVSDMKWEGETWISPETLARNVTKRSRRHDVLVGQTPGTATTATTAGRPPNPHDPLDASGLDNGPTRRRDKDRIPSKTTWVWDDSTTAWQLVDRVKAFQAGAFYAYAAIPPKQEELLQLMLDDATTAIDESFLRDGLVPRLNRTHPVSLRLLDWLVVDYAREKDIAYRRYVPTLKREMIVVMHSLYTSWLHRWRRRHYDPFRRRHRIYFELDGETYSTTVAQLHFFYMARLFGFLDYATDHLDEILPHMKATLAGTSEAKNGARKRGEEYRRRPLVSKARPKAFMSCGVFELKFSLDDVDAVAESTVVESTNDVAPSARDVEVGLRDSLACLFVEY